MGCTMPFDHTQDPAQSCASLGGSSPEPFPKRPSPSSACFLVLWRMLRAALRTPMQPWLRTSAELHCLPPALAVPPPTITTTKTTAITATTKWTQWQKKRRQKWRSMQRGTQTSRVLAALQNPPAGRGRGGTRVAA
ncbi:hypothetical protein DUNSADRAFT_6855 [Dunaliella salina]|uniref:Encoded protein n=1 Tax=Dunaliella salina TaxID=3046 RepID=A0ABQ7GMJ1_DUNSA|nr:hypothetical protein DUNSADRAFT_6855 [Dunaliella salina]|eukprot:KAF5835821.1 hypothetical protein DUNSADRAFT_6855 [Dunaliella salina]